MTATATVIHCDAYIGQTAGEFRWMPIRCGQSVGITQYEAAAPFLAHLTVGYCSLPGHRESVERRFGPDETLHRICPDCGGPIARSDALRCGECSRKDRTRRPLAERFWEKVDQSGGPDACWLWTGSTTGGGYGYISPGGRAEGVPAHRVSWELHNDLIPDGLWVLHRCDNRPCVNPAHLFLGTVGDNNRDMFAKGRAWQQQHPERMPRGEDHHSAILSDAQVAEIRHRYANGETNQSALAREYGVSHGTVNRYVTRGHRASVERRFPRLDAAPDPIDGYKRLADRDGWPA